jgi:hypothetical protein
MTPAIPLMEVSPTRSSRILGLGLQGRSPNVSALRRLNLYLEFHAEGRNKTEVSAHRTPGLALFYDFGDTPVQGVHAVGDVPLRGAPREFRPTSL